MKSPFKDKKIRDKAIALYKTGEFTTRQVSNELKRLGLDRSHTWVALVVKDIKDK